MYNPITLFSLQLALFMGTFAAPAPDTLAVAPAPQAELKWFLQPYGSGKCPADDQLRGDSGTTAKDCTNTGQTVYSAKWQVTLDGSGKDFDIEVYLSENCAGSAKSIGIDKCTSINFNSYKVILLD